MKRWSMQSTIPALLAVLGMFAILSLNTTPPAAQMPAGQFSTQGGDLRALAERLYRQNQLARQAARTVQRRILGASYQAQPQDLQTLQNGLVEMRTTFVELASRAQPRLLAGYRSMSELRGELDTMIATVNAVPAQPGSPADRRLISQVCREVDLSLARWEQDVRQTTSRLRFVW